MENNFEDDTSTSLVTNEKINQEIFSIKILKQDFSKYNCSMGRKKFKPEDKKSNFGITLDPKIMELLDIQSEKEGISKSELIEKSLKQKINKENEQRKS